MSAMPSSRSFKWLIICALIVPIGLMVCVALVLVVQIRGLIATTARVEQTDDIIARANDGHKLMLNMETGLRGYMLTGNLDFLEPFTQTRPKIEGEMTELRHLVSDNPPQLKILDQMEGVRREWLVFADKQVQLRQTNGDYMKAITEAHGKQLMDQSRGLFADFIQKETILRKSRSDAAVTSSHRSLVTVGVMTLLAGAVLAWLAHHQFKELAGNYEKALSAAQDLNATLEDRVTERTKQVEERSAQLAEANEELEAFAYSISHDLRAPMRHIAGFVDLLKKSIGASLSPADHENLVTIGETARNAARMVDDLLAFSRIGRTPLHRACVDAADLVERARRNLEPETQDRTIQWEIAPLASAYGDPALLRMVFENLLSNAIKYTAKNPRARIEVGMSPKDDAVAYFVRDNGVGFDMKYADKLFGVFQRLHRAEEFEGTGIGLANVRRIILRHGGRVWASGKVAKGATFYFSLPPESQTTDIS
jgi:signal transduction histidine kinase